MNANHQKVQKHKFTSTFLSETNQIKIKKNKPGIAQSLYAGGNSKKRKKEKQGITKERGDKRDHPPDAILSEHLKK